MNSDDISQIRLESQLLINSELKSPKEIVSWMGAIQAQDYPMSRWAIGVRLPGSVVAVIDKAIDEGEIIRTHLLRPTWHYTTAEDAAWLVELSAKQIKTAQRARDKVLELDEKVYSKSNKVIEKSLVGGKQLPREELAKELKQAGFATDQNRLSHLLMRAELEKIICSGAAINDKQTYALFPERVKKPKRLSKEEALSELAQRYFTSRCPARVKDFAWWSGLPAGDVRQAVEGINHSFHTESIAGVSYLLPNDSSIHVHRKSSAYFLPPYDEFTLSYADRSASIPAELEEHLKRLSDRGVFRPIIVLDGQVIGVWKRQLTKKALQVDMELFAQIDIKSISKLKQAASDYSAFMQIEDTAIIGLE